jgi:hypothetical protein
MITELILSKLLLESGTKVTFLSRPPNNEKDIGQCLERLLGRNILASESCSIRKEDYLEKSA